MVFQGCGFIVARATDLIASVKTLQAAGKLTVDWIRESEEQVLRRGRLQLFLFHELDLLVRQRSFIAIKASPRAEPGIFTREFFVRKYTIRFPVQYDHA